MTRAMILTLLATLPLSACQVAAAQSAPFSPVIEANGVLYIAGHLGYEAESRTYPDNITDQTRLTLENIGTTLASVKADHADIVRCQVFMTEIEGFQKMNAAYKAFFPKNPPARTTVEVSGLAAPDALIEIECTAVRGHGEKMELENG